MTILGLLLATLLFAACDGRGSSGSSGSSQSRSAEFDPAHPMYSRFEGDGAPNVCSSDLDCIVGGCSNEVCAAEAVMTTCEALGELPRGDCLCVASECLWAKPITEECSSDADCRTASNYCGSCSCEALAPGEEPTRCDVPVLCVMDPCDFMVAVCDRGTCVTTAGSR